MTDITVSLPNIDSIAYYSFKEPLATYISNRYNFKTEQTKFKVVSIIAMRDTIRIDLRDPYTELYVPIGLTEIEYKRDLERNVLIITLSYEDRYGIEKLIRIPHNYINSISNIADVPYTNRVLVFDLGYLPEDLDLQPILNDVKDFLTDLTGVTPEVKEVVTNGVELVSQFEHDTRETIRTNNVTIHKTLSTMLAEKTLAYDSLVIRLNNLLQQLGP